MRQLASALAVVTLLAWRPAVPAQAASSSTSGAAGQPMPPEPPAEPPIPLPPVPPIPRTPAFLPALQDPKENPTTPQKVQLGQMLFFEKLLSKNRTPAGPAKEMVR